MMHFSFSVKTGPSGDYGTQLEWEGACSQDIFLFVSNVFFNVKCINCPGREDWKPRTTHSSLLLFTLGYKYGTFLFSVLLNPGLLAAHLTSFNRRDRTLFITAL